MKPELYLTQPYVFLKQLNLILTNVFILGVAPMDDAMSDYFDSRSRRSADSGLFSRSIRRTLPFQLVPQPPLAYARSNNYVGEPIPVAINTNLDDEKNFKGK